MARSRPYWLVLRRPAQPASRSFPSTVQVESTFFSLVEWSRTQLDTTHVRWIGRFFGSIRLGGDRKVRIGVQFSQLGVQRSKSSVEIEHPFLLPILGEGRGWQLMRADLLPLDQIQ